MKAKIKLSSSEKVVIAGAVVSGVVIGIIPTLIVGGIGYYFKDDVENFLVKEGIMKRDESLISKFKNLWKN